MDQVDCERSLDQSGLIRKLDPKQRRTLELFQNLP